MKILFVFNPLLDDYLKSGNSIMATNLGRQLIKFGNQVDCVASESMKQLMPDSVIYSVDNLGKRNYIKQTLEESVRIFKNGSYDVMHIHITQMSILSGIKNLIPEDIPVVYTQHSSTILGRFSLNYRPDARFLSSERKNFKLICPSHAMKNIWIEYIESLDMNNVEVVYNGVSSNDVMNQYNDRSNDLLAIGRIDPNKGIKEIAEFCIEYNHPVTIVGDFGLGSMKASEFQEEYYNSFVNLCETHPDIITWIKYLDNKALIKLMADSKIFISLSSKESFSLTTAEALSVGTPVLFYEEDAIEELTDCNSSVMISRESCKRKQKKSRFKIYEEALEDLRVLIDTRSITLESVLDRFNSKGLSIESCAYNYLNIYKEITNETQN